MKKYVWILYSTAAIGVIAVIAVNVYLYQIRQHREYLLSLGLHGAAVHYPERIPEIMKLGVEVDELDTNGHSPLYQAVIFKKVAAVRQLLEYEADPNLTSNDPINPTPLLRATFIATSAEQVEIVKLLLQAGADPNEATHDGESAILRACSTAGNHHAREIVKELIAAGADVNKENERGMTPLQYAVISGEEQVVDLLLTAGADPEQRNDAGFRAIDQINSTGNAEAIQNVFKKHGADSVRRPELFAKHRKEE